ncbi:MAG: hypothetical protein AAB922_04820 [Patescibacteria group bacterium]
MTASALTDKLVEAVKLGVITEQEACEFLIAVKRGDKEAIARLMEEHKNNP